jgi:hypothetical protein
MKTLLWLTMSLGPIGNESVYREALHVYDATGGTRARMGLHVSTADVMS